MYICQYSIRFVVYNFNLLLIHVYIYFLCINKTFHLCIVITISLFSLINNHISIYYIST